jgi:hypothetical protein
MKICNSEEELRDMICPITLSQHDEEGAWTGIMCIGSECAAYRKDYYPYEDYYTCYCGLAGNPRG